MVSVSELSLAYGGLPALSDVSIEVGAGQFCDAGRAERGKRIHAVQGDQRHCSRALRDFVRASVVYTFYEALEEI